MADAVMWKPTKKMANDLSVFSQNEDYFVKNFNSIKGKFAGKYIAVYNMDIVIVADSVDSMLTQLRQRFNDEELQRLFLTYVPMENEVRIA